MEAFDDWFASGEADTQLTGNGGQDQFRIANQGQIDKLNRTVERFFVTPGHRQSEPRFADAARSDQGQQFDLGLLAIETTFRQSGLPAENRRSWLWKERG